MLLQVQHDRPPEGLQQGRYPVPRWTVAAFGAAVVLGALLFLAWRARRALRPPVVEDDPRPSKRR
jgi:hypothetical protein